MHVGIGQFRSVFTLILLFICSFSYAATYYSLADGDWTEAIWSTDPDALPVNGVTLPNSITNGNITNSDEIVIRHTVTNSTGVQINNGGTITIANGGYFDVTNVSMNNGSSLDVEPGGVLDAEVIDTKSGSTITNNGTIVTSDCNGVPGTCQSTPLPVELLSFLASLNENGVILQWSTASELNNDFFTLERSKNGKEFEFLAKVEGNGTSHIQIDYSYAHRDAYIGLSYYRLSQTDYDGTTEIFPALSVLFDGHSRLAVFPNPVKNEFIKIRSTGYESNEILEATVYNLQGRKIETQLLRADIFGNLDSEINIIRPHEQGTYILEIKSSTNKEVLKIYKE